MSAVLALLASLVWGTSDFVGGLTARRLPIRALVLSSQAVGLTILLVVVSAAGLWTSDGRALVWGLIGGSFGIVALGAFYRGLAIGPMSIVSPVASIGVLVPFVGGLARGEHPAALQLVGAVLAVGGVAMAARPRESNGGAGRHSVAVGLGLASAVGFGVVLLAVQQGSMASVAMTLVWMRVLGVAVLGLSVLATARTAQRVVRWPGRAEVLPVLVVGSFDLGATRCSRSPAAGTCWRWSPCCPRSTRPSPRCCLGPRPGAARARSGGSVWWARSPASSLLAADRAASGSCRLRRAAQERRPAASSRRARPEVDRWGPAPGAGEIGADVTGPGGVVVPDRPRHRPRRRRSRRSREGSPDHPRR